MLKDFVAAREDEPGQDWAARFRTGREAARRWYLGQGLAPPPSAAECRAAIARHMPELLAPYDQACALTAEDDLDRCILSHYRPPPMGDGCSQAVWLGDGGPALVRNYDFRLDLVSDRFESTSWFGREVIAKAQRPWGGCIDGMNADGLVASLTAGGSPAQGLGFAVILLLRYVLETCSRVDEAVTALCRIPVALSQNVTLLDRSGDHATVFLGPDRLPAVSRVPVCTNHQDTAASRQFDASTRSLARHDALMTALADPDMTLAALTARMLEPPLFSRRAASATAYTAVYRPTDGRVDYLWPGKRWTQRIGNFTPDAYTHDYGALEGV
ncbi:putative choloylglycine hydrolase [Stella humosa]|uniref:Putative choloylglycine hydrolase n=1 Tax=Stella humosa TaxID=94 RepID=A0A3N1MBK9_9PROT|nr:C45 family autoproteolytic acyltransferase/hydolase [Stella humosa]ROQ01121.1 putative choloylglycine hydrolase [Stella humosa]BBK31493.1 peptidase C45 [Stella humosa]